MQADFDYFAVPLPEPPVVSGEPETQRGPTGQVFSVWANQYLSVEAAGRTQWFALVATNGREMPGWN